MEIDGKLQEVKGYKVVRKLFRFMEFQFGYFHDSDGDFPLYTVKECSERFDDISKRDFCKFLSELDKIEHAEIYDILEKFAQIHIQEEIDEFQKEIGRDCKSLSEELLYRQDVVKYHLSRRKRIKMIDEERVL